MKTHEIRPQKPLIWASVRIPEPLPFGVWRLSPDRYIQGHGEDGVREVQDFLMEIYSGKPWDVFQGPDGALARVRPEDGYRQEKTFVCAGHSIWSER
jgi:hypothetical protein